MKTALGERIAPECGCATDGYITRGMCKTHYDRWVQKTPKDQRPLSPLASRTFSEFINKTSSDSGCWLWTGPTIRNGYGFWSGKLVPGDGRQGLAHRLSLASVEPPADETWFACHKCDNPPCVNPEHLYWGTREDNTRDYVERQGAWNKGMFAEACKRGHLIAGDNLRIAGSAGRRLCRECDNDRKREVERQRRRAAGVPEARYWKHLEPKEVARAIRRVTEGATMSQIAAELNLSVATVQRYLPMEDGYASARARTRSAR